MPNLNRPALARDVRRGQQASMGAERMGQVGYRAAGQGIPATSQYFGSTPNLRRTSNMSAGPNDPLFGDQFDMGMDADLDDDDTGMGGPRPQPFPGKPTGPWMPGDPGPSPYRPTGGPRPPPSRPNTPWLPGAPRPSPYQRPTGGPRPATPTTPATPAPWLKDLQVPNRSGSPHAYGATTGQTPFDQRGPGTSKGLGGVTGSPGAQGPPGQAGAAGPGPRPVPLPIRPGAPAPPNPQPVGGGGFNPWTPHPGGWTPPPATPAPATPAPTPVVLPQILQGARDAMDWAQDAYEQDPTVQAIDEMERDSAPQPDPSPRYPDANRVRNRLEMKRDWARRQTDAANARRAQEQAEAQNAALQSAGPPPPLPHDPGGRWNNPNPVMPQFERQTSAFRPVNRMR